MGTIKIMGENLTMGTKKVIREFHSFKDATTYGRILKKYLKDTNLNYEETLGFASICCVVGPNGNKYQFYYAF